MGLHLTYWPTLEQKRLSRKGRWLLLWRRGDQGLRGGRDNINIHIHIIALARQTTGQIAECIFQLS